MDTETKLLLWGIAIGVAALAEERYSDAAEDNQTAMRNVLASAYAAATHTKEELDNQIDLAVGWVAQRAGLPHYTPDGTESVMAYLADVKDAAQQSPRPTPVTDIGLSPVMDCARELAVLLDATGPVTRNVLRERVRTKLRPYTTTALAFAVERGAFTLAGSPVRGGEYTLTDPEALDLSWSTIRSLSKSRKPARALSGARGT